MYSVKENDSMHEEDIHLSQNFVPEKTRELKTIFKKG